MFLRSNEHMQANQSTTARLTLGYSDVPQLYGQVDLLLVTSDGRIVTRLDLGRNIITVKGRSNMAHLLAGDDTANKIVSTVKFGDGGHDPDSPTEALPPAAEDTALFGDEIISKSVSSSFPDGAAGTKVQFSATVAEGEGNGSGAQAYSEVALYDAEGNMMTHKTFGLITKSDAFAIVLKYTIVL